MGLFDENTNYNAGGYLRVEGDFLLTITSMEYDDRYFPKYNIMAEVATGPHRGELVQGMISKPTEQYMNDNDRSLGGFSFTQTGAYVVGAGITDEVNAMEKVTIGNIAKLLTGKTIKAHVQLTKKSRDLLASGETAGLFYEIGKIYKYSNWSAAEMESSVASSASEPLLSNVDTSLPFDMGDGSKDNIPF